MFAHPRVLAAALFVAALAALTSLPANNTFADGPKDNIVDGVRPVPPVGNDIPAEDLAEIKKGLAELQQLIKDIGKHELLPDVLIYEKAVRWPLDYKEIYDGKGAKPAATVKKVLAAGLERAKQLKDGKTPWTTQTGGVLRGYKSQIDGSVQPYWIIVPKEYDFAGKAGGDTGEPVGGSPATKRHRLDFWWHGRFENTVEAGFMANPAGASGIIPAPGAFVLHPFGRFSNANKFAGEIDTFECLKHASGQYRIDHTRLVARGFSMGGAACWQYGAHFPSLWAACAPGAGFSETPEFLKVFQGEDTTNAPWYEKKLWHMYNASDTPLNFFNLPTVAYSGADDRQKQAADVMAREMKKVGLELKHVIGPKTGHGYEKDAKVEVNKLIDAFVEKGREQFPRKIQFITYTLRYNESFWVTVDGLEKHWTKAHVDAEIDGTAVKVKTENVSSLKIRMPAYNEALKLKSVEIDGTPLQFDTISGMAGMLGYYVKVNGKWAAKVQPPELRKKHGLQGPIDDAFMSSFVMVKPSGKALNEKVGKWSETEMKHAVDHWRKQFRGDAPVKADTEITTADMSSSNLVLWGDPSSNAVLAKIADKLPIKWTDKGVTVGKDTYEAGTHVPVLIYPNPLNTSKYVVINSGFTFREYDYLNNARQVSKMPDYAVLDVTTSPNSRYPGKVVRGGFFGEKWELLADDGK